MGLHQGAAPQWVVKVRNSGVAERRGYWYVYGFHPKRSNCLPLPIILIANKLTMFHVERKACDNSSQQRLSAEQKQEYIDIGRRYSGYTRSLRNCGGTYLRELLSSLGR